MTHDLIANYVQLAQLAALAGIFFRLGGLTEIVKHQGQKISNLENRKAAFNVAKN